MNGGAIYSPRLVYIQCNHYVVTDDHLSAVSTVVHVSLYAKQKHLGCKKGETNQKQQLSDYGYIAILATKSFDIKLRPRIS